MAGTDTIEIYRGEAVELGFTMNPVVNITGWNLEMTIEDAPAAKRTTVGAEIVSGVAGTFKVELDAADTAALAPRKYQYDVWRTDSGSERVVAIGDFVVLDVARAAG